MTEPLVYSLSYTLDAGKWNLPTITDSYYFLDAAYHIVKEVLEYPPISIQRAYIKIDLELYEYIDSILEHEDLDMINEIVEAIYNYVIKVLGSEVFAPLLDYDGEVLDVQYRYEYRERYVKFYIWFRESTEKIQYGHL